MSKKGHKLNWETINRIRNMKKQGYTIRKIAKIVNSSTKTVQKYLNEEIQEPKLYDLLEEVKRLNSTLQQQENRIRVLESKLIDDINHHETEILQPNITTSEHIKTYTAREAVNRTGVSYTTVKKRCGLLGVKKTKNGQWVITEDDLKAIKAYKN